MTVRFNTRSAPTQRSLAYLRAQGCIVDVSETKRGPTSRDWCGAFDITGVTRDGRFVACQTTSASNFASRVTKVRACAELPELVRRGALVLVHGWSPNSDVPRTEAFTRQNSEQSQPGGQPCPLNTNRATERVADR